MTKADFLKMLEKFPDDFRIKFTVVGDYQDEDGYEIFPILGNVKRVDYGAGYSLDVVIEV